MSQEPNLNIATLRSYDLQPFISLTLHRPNVMMSSGLNQQDFFFFRYKKKKKTMKARGEGGGEGGGGDKIRDGEADIGVIREIV